jgi:hypothetical protein
MQSDGITLLFRDLSLGLLKPSLPVALPDALGASACGGEAQGDVPAGARRRCEVVLETTPPGEAEMTRLLRLRRA